MKGYEGLSVDAWWTIVRNNIDDRWSEKHMSPTTTNDDDNRRDDAPAALNGNK